jgi:HAD superfamily hydrolase (TIGR01509 family)
MTRRQYYEGLIFDFNGVLFWDDAIQRNSWRLFVSRLRDEPLTDEEIDLHVHGRNGRHTMEYLLGVPISQEKADELTEEKERIYRQMCLALEDQFVLSPGAVGLLNTLTLHKIPFTIATASGKRNVDFFARHLNLENWFDLENIVYDDGKTPGKPAPDLYLRAANRLGFAPEACVVIEDSRSGLQAAYHAGIGHIIALGPQSKHEQLVQFEGIDQVLETLGEVQVETLFGVG